MTEIHLFDRDPSPLVFSEGAIIFSAGDPATDMFAVIEGEVDLTFGDETVETAGPGSIFGEVALVDQGPRSGSAVARTAVKVVRVDRDRFVRTVQQHPTFALRVMEVMAGRLRRKTADDGD